ncbi:hypothetical protein V8E54_014350 [Elaphomyces granulatus]
MPILHLVLVQVKPDADAAEVQEAFSRIMKLKDICLHPQTKLPYMRASFGGRDNSTEGLQHGMTHVFVEEFETEEDRKYYLEKEPGHKEFVKSLGGLVEKVQVIDFIPGIF